MGIVLVFILVLGGLGLMFDLAEPKHIVRYLLWLLIAPFAIRLIFCQLTGLLKEPSADQQLVVFALLFFAALLIISMLFPKSKWIRRAISVVIDLTAFLFTLPFRIIWRSVRLIAERERHPVRLSPTPVVVGRRPQMEPPESHGSPESGRV